MHIFLGKPHFLIDLDRSYWSPEVDIETDSLGMPQGKYMLCTHELVAQLAATFEKRSESGDIEGAERIQTLLDAITPHAVDAPLDRRHYFRRMPKNKGDEIWESLTTSP